MNDSASPLVSIERRDDGVAIVRLQNPKVNAISSEVLRQIASGYSNKEIAARLELSVKTVEAHKANAMRKLGLNGRIDIVKYAILQGWLHNA